MFEIVLIMFITMALAEIVKRARLVRAEHVPLFVVLCAVLIVAGYGAPNIQMHIGAIPSTHAAISGIIIGLLSCGLYSFVKCLTNLIH